MHFRINIYNVMCFNSFQYSIRIIYNLTTLHLLVEFSLIHLLMEFRFIYVLWICTMQFYRTCILWWNVSFLLFIFLRRYTEFYSVFIEGSFVEQFWKIFCLYKIWVWPELYVIIVTISIKKKKKKKNAILYDNITSKLSL